jgi:hypothetical protein
MVDASPVKTDMMTHCAKARAAGKEIHMSRQYIQVD